MKKLTNLQRQKLVSKYIKDILANDWYALNEMVMNERIDASDKIYIVNYVIDNHRLTNRTAPNELYAAQTLIYVEILIKEYKNSKNWFMYYFTELIDEDVNKAFEYIKLLKGKISDEDYNELKFKADCKIYQI